MNTRQLLINVLRDYWELMDLAFKNKRFHNENVIDFPSKFQADIMADAAYPYCGSSIFLIGIIEGFEDSEK